MEINSVLMCVSIEVFSRNLVSWSKHTMSFSNCDVDQDTEIHMNIPHLAVWFARYWDEQIDSLGWNAVQMVVPWLAYVALKDGQQSSARTCVAQAGVGSVWIVEGDWIWKLVKTSMSWALFWLVASSFISHMLRVNIFSMQFTFLLLEHHCNFALFWSILEQKSWLHYLGRLLVYPCCTLGF